MVSAKEFLEQYRKENAADPLREYLDDIRFLNQEGVTATGIFNFLKQNGVECSYKQVLNRLRKIENPTQTQKQEPKRQDNIASPALINKKTVLENLSEDFDLMAAAKPKEYAK